MCNLHTSYFLLTAYAAMAFVRWLIDDLHIHLLTCLDVIYGLWVKSGSAGCGSDNG